MRDIIRLQAVAPEYSPKKNDQESVVFILHINTLTFIQVEVSESKFNF